MDRLVEAKLAFIGSGEVTGRKWLAADFSSDSHISGLITDGFVEIEGQVLICTARGWRHLDSRPIDI